MVSVQQEVVVKQVAMEEALKVVAMPQQVAILGQVAVLEHVAVLIKVVIVAEVEVNLYNPRVQVVEAKEDEYHSLMDVSH